jgi:hypothetical protein
MKSEKQIPVEDRLGEMEMDLQLIKSMLKEVLTNQANGTAVSEERIIMSMRPWSFSGLKNIFYMLSAPVAIYPRFV